MATADFSDIDPALPLSQIVLRNIQQRTNALRSNEASASPPSSPADYQLWSSTSGILYMYDGGAWIPLGYPGQNGMPFVEVLTSNAALSSATTVDNRADAVHVVSMEHASSTDRGIVLPPLDGDNGVDNLREGDLMAYLHAGSGYWGNSLLVIPDTGEEIGETGADSPWYLSRHGSWVILKAGNSRWHVVGGSYDGRLHISNADSPFTVGPEHLSISEFYVDASGGAVTINLPAVASVAGSRPKRFVKIDNSVNAVTINRNGLDTIEGATSTTLSSQYDKVRLVPDYDDPTSPTACWFTD